jgi:CRISPR-associated endonuclease Cas1, subtype II/NMENI
MIKQTLYFGNPAKLSVENCQLRIAVGSTRQGEVRVVTRPLEDIGVVIIDCPQILLTAPVMQGLMQHGAAMVVCDDRHMPTGLLLNMEGSAVQSERFRIHLSASQPLKKQLWQQTVVAKIKNQAAAMAIIANENPLALIRMANKVKSGDSGNVEAQAASYYWKVLFDRFGGIKRSRDGEDPNTMLNYGYAIVRAMMARSLVAAGMHPSLGIFHRNKYNAYCLADDIMEPYRPYVDILVMEICERYGVQGIDNREIKAAILGIVSKETVLNGLRYPLMTAISETAVSLFKCFNGESRKIKYPEIPIP